MNQAVHANPNSAAKIMQLDELNSIENDIKRKIEAMWKAGYSYVIICEYATNALGIQRCTQVMKAISKIQHILDQINGDLNNFKKLLEEIEKLGFPAGWDPSKHGNGGKDGNVNEYAKEIVAWLQKPNDLGIKGPDGKPLTNAQAFQHIWNDLFGTGTNKADPKNSKTCLLKQLQNAMNNPWYKQTDNTSYRALKALNEGAFSGKGKEWGKRFGVSFQQFLQGGIASDNVWDIMRTMVDAMCTSYYKNNDVKPDGAKTVPSQDPVGDVTSETDSVVQSVTTLNSTQSSDMSEFAQQLTALINVVQQMLQQNDKANSVFVNNQQAR